MAQHEAKSSQDQDIEQLVADLAGEGRNADLVRSMLRTVLDINPNEIDRLEMKIASRSLAEMTDAWRVFGRYEEEPKVTIFGSARTPSDHADYVIAHRFGELMAELGWMVMTGAGPGIMTAGIEGAGRENSFGINIDLPFEAGATEAIAGDPKVIDFKYFFTRKLSFIKEAAAYALFPGGFGTMDEAFELLTLLQTGKTFPAPVVLIDAPDSNYWSSWIDFVSEELLDGGLISGPDLNLYHHTQSAEEAVGFIDAFYSSYHSIRFVGKRLVIRLWTAPDASQLAELTEEFGDIIESGRIERIKATKSERRDDDVVDLDRIAFRFDRYGYARLHEMIHRINEMTAKGQHHTPLTGRGAQPADTEAPEE